MYPHKRINQASTASAGIRTRGSRALLDDLHGTSLGGAAARVLPTGRDDAADGGSGRTLPAMECFAFCWAAIDSYQVIELLTGRRGLEPRIYGLPASRSSKTGSAGRTSCRSWCGRLRSLRLLYLAAVQPVVEASSLPLRSALGRHYQVGRATFQG